MNNNFTPIQTPIIDPVLPKKKRDSFLVVLMSVSAVLLAVLGTVVALLFTGSYKAPLNTSANNSKAKDIVVSAAPSSVSEKSASPTVSFQSEPDMLEKELNAVSFNDEATPSGMPSEPSLDAIVE